MAPEKNVTGRVACTLVVGNHVLRMGKQDWEGAVARKIEDIEGIGEHYGDCLRASGVATPEALLRRGATPVGRKGLAQSSGLGEPQITHWVHMADLCRVAGVGGQFAELLARAQVTTILELAAADATTLARRIAALNREQRLARLTPSPHSVHGWIQHAKKLPRIVD